MTQSTAFFLRESDKRVKVLKDNVAVSSSTLQTVYAKYLNFINTRFDVVENNTLKSYDISLKYADKIIPKLNNVAAGTVPRYLNFDNTHFNLTESIPSDNYTLALKYPGKVLVNLAGVAVNTTPRKLNYSSGITATENVGTDSIDLVTTGGNPATGLKTGRFTGGSGTTNDSVVGEGLMQNWQAINNINAGVDTDGAYSSMDTTTTSQTNSEISSTEGSAPFRGSLNPKMWMKIKIPNVANQRWYNGWTDTILLPSNTFNFLDNRTGFGIRYDTTTDTTIKVLNNDGGASAIVTDTSITPVNNTVYNLYFEYNNTTSTYKVTINTTPFTKTTRIPAATTGLGWTTRMQTSTPGIRSMYNYGMYCEQDK